MPAFIINEQNPVIDDSTLTDTWDFRKGEVWDQNLVGHESKQIAPARISRGTNLPLVKAESEKPFVVSAQHPNGSIAVATLGRINSDKGYQIIKADITLEVNKAARNTIGIFGYYKSLSLKFDKTVGKVTLLAQDLAGNKSVNITNLVSILNNTILIPGELIESVGISAASEGDESEPGLVLMIK